MRFNRRRPIIDLRPLHSVAATDIDALLDTAFGADRRGRTAYLIRAGMPVIDSLSFAALKDGELAGTIQCWPVALHRDDGGTVPLVMVGPVAIRPDLQGLGYGRALMAEMQATADALDLGGALMLIGDPEYYARFGFSADCTGQWRAPGPVERHRLLAHGCAVPDAPGMLGPRPGLGDA